MRLRFDLGCHFERSREIFLFTFCCLLSTIFLFSCGNNNSEKQKLSSSDSLPPDLVSINQQIDKDRGNPELYFKRAKYFFSEKKFSDAIGDMNIVLKIDSAKPRYYIFLSDLYFTQNKTRDTRDKLRKAISLDTTNTEALMKYSQLFYLLRKYDTAMFYINRSLHYDKANAVANFQKGMILKEWGDTTKAISSFQDAVKIDQKYYDAYMQLGILFAAKKNHMALDYFNDALSIDPNSTETHYAKGKLLQDVGDYDNALAEYNTILQTSPDNQDATFNIGAIYYEQKKYDDAIEKFNLTIKRDENFFRGYYGRGRCYEAKKEKDKAIDDYKHCLALKPDFKLASIQMDIIMRKKG